MPIVLIILTGVFGYLYWKHKTTTLTRNCRWRADRTKDTDTRRYYHCAACGADALTATDHLPRDCKAPNPPAL